MARSGVSLAEMGLRMDYPDLNLLIALDVLLEEESVIGAARRMNLSPPAMSRTLARIRKTFGDPILVQAGRRMVPTTRALELRNQVRTVANEALGLMQPASEEALRTLRRTFTIRASDPVVAVFASVLQARLHGSAPLVQLRFAAETEGDDEALREGRIDLAIGASRALHPEVRVQTLMEMEIIGVARSDHPLFDREITADRYAAFDQIAVSRRGRMSGPIDTALASQGLHRRVVMVLPSYSIALMALVRTGLLLYIPDPYREIAEGMGLRCFSIPLGLPLVAVRQAWHPRFDNDGPHRWLRSMVHDVFSEGAVATAPASRGRS